MNVTSIDYATRPWLVFWLVIADALDELAMLLRDMVAQAMELTR